MTCRLVRRHIGVMVDGELDPATQIEFERHLAVCASCQELLAFERAMRDQVQVTLKRTFAPDSLRARVCGALDEADREREQVRRSGWGQVIRVPSMKARHAVPLAAAAAALLLVFGGPLSATETSGSGARASQQQASMGQGASPLLEDVVRLHSSALPADVVGNQPQRVARYFQNKVAFPVHTAQFNRPYVRLTGARLANVRERRAAALFYDVGGHRMTLVVFEPPVAPFPMRGVIRTRLAGHELTYEQVEGHVVPVRHYHGLTYAMTGNLPRRQLLELAATFQVRP